MKTAKEVFDKNYEFYRNMEGKPAIPLESRPMIFGTMDQYAQIKVQEAEQSKWISVEERLPETKDGEPTQVIVWSGNEDTAGAIYLDKKFYSMEDWQSESAIEDLSTIEWTRIITHWQPLPNPPKI